MGLRLGFALVVCSEPDVLLVDEVLAVGDASFQHRGLERVAELQRGGCAVVLVSHDLELIARSCEQVAVLDAGILTHLGTPADAIDRYRRSDADADADTGPDAEPVANVKLFGAGEGPVAEAKLFETSWRVQAARRRRGV